MDSNKESLRLSIFPYLLFKKTKLQFQSENYGEVERYIMYSPDTIYVMHCNGVNEYNVLKMNVEKEYNNGKEIKYNNYELFIIPEHLYGITIYELDSQKKKIQNDMEKRAIHKIIRRLIPYFVWY